MLYNYAAFQNATDNQSVSLYQYQYILLTVFLDEQEAIERKLDIY